MQCILEKSMYSEKELCYVPGTHVHLCPVSSTSGKEFTIPGQVLMCRLKQQVRAEQHVAAAALNSTSETRDLGNQTKTK
jgi:hypothetical protein